MALWCTQPARLGISATDGTEEALEILRDQITAGVRARLVTASLQGQRLLLLDDVMTTGATLYSAANCLLQAGAAQVSAVVWARTPRA